MESIACFRRIFVQILLKFLQIDDCKTDTGYKCKFPSIYKGNELKGCTNVDSPTGDLWCHTEGNDGPKWGYCTGLCPINCNMTE